MIHTELPKRIWDLDAQTLEDLGADQQSIQAYAEIELDEDINRLGSGDSPSNSATVEAAIRTRHRMHWGLFSNA
ncbi:hypothetical protein [Massilia violaceinigra]|uniref:hypothetical protein n=1 Tax=Massilia violaceinigra TaxID=2045208 RepID=UPI0012FDDFF3|nr:hypothetical protein [Massilia violaceinigra]